MSNIGAQLCPPLHRRLSNHRPQQPRTIRRRLSGVFCCATRVCVLCWWSLATRIARATRAWSGRRGSGLAPEMMERRRMELEAMEAEALREREREEAQLNLK
eukprot:1880338-Rhodomonas_salina.1